MRLGQATHGTKEGRPADMWVCAQDMTSTAEAKRVVQETIEQLGGIDIVISNAVSAMWCSWLLLDEWVRADVDCMCARGGPSSATGRITRG
jgi:NAD(P)-dependent dehydrogenase (short-subunit alcohol dehydrogenase family)